MFDRVARNMNESGTRACRGLSENVSDKFTIHHMMRNVLKNVDF